MNRTSEETFENAISLPKEHRSAPIAAVTGEIALILEELKQNDPADRRKHRSLRARLFTMG